MKNGGAAPAGQMRPAFFAAKLPFTLFFLPILLFGAQMGAFSLQWG
jgi:hypothetical protein